MVAENRSKTSDLYYVAVPRPLRSLFVYRLPQALTSASAKTVAPLPGVRVRVPFGNTTLTGVMLSALATDDPVPDAVRDIAEVLDSTPLLLDDQIALLKRAAGYYHHPIGEVFAAALPPIAGSAPEPEKRYRAIATREMAWGRRHRQRDLYDWLQNNPDATQRQVRDAGFRAELIQALVEAGLVAADVSPEEKESAPATVPVREPLPRLSPQQQAAVEAVPDSGYAACLIDGATGSGKTEVYLQAAAPHLANGRQLLYLIPEIGLADQTLTRLRNRFQARIGVYHSGLSDGERATVWMRALRGELDILVGTRSALFLPLRRPGLMVIDEEHDLSFKQQEGFHYSARDLALLRARDLGIPVLLGSATPSLESLQRAESGRQIHLHLPDRVGGRSIPAWECIDLNKTQVQAGISAPLRDAIQHELDRGRQVLLHLNRRGFATALACDDCGWVAQCPGCDRPLTLHRAPHALFCHHCGHRQPDPRRCPRCSSRRLHGIGQGTERTEQFLQQQFPATPIVRIDRDAHRSHRSLQAAFRDVARGEPCVLIGTQLLTKGHDFPGVTLVGVLDGDQGLFSSDFRATERLAQLVTQVSGRAGRGDIPGTALFQTRYPDHPLVRSLLSQPYARLAAQLLQQRRHEGLPPYEHMALFRAESSEAADAFALLQELARLPLRPLDERLQRIGPLPAPLEKRRGRFRLQLQLIHPERGSLHAALRQLLEFTDRRRSPRSLRWSLDVDPQSLD